MQTEDREQGSGVRVCGGVCVTSTCERCVNVSHSSESATREYRMEPDELKDPSKVGTCQGVGK